MTPRVAILIEASRFDGPVRNLLYALNHLPRTDFRFFTFIRTGAPSSDMLRVLSEKGFPLSVIPERFRFDPTAFLRLGRVLRDFRPDVLQVHNTKSRLFALAGAVLGWWPRSSLVFFFHGETWVDAKQKIYNLLDRLLFRLAPRVVVVSPSQEALLATWGVPRSHLRVIANAIPPQDPGTPPPPPPWRFMTAGRFSQEKGQDILLQAFARLPGDRMGERLICFGEGPQEAALKRLARSLGIAEEVEFAGYVPDLTTHYRRSHLFVLPSRSEGLPNVLLEAAMLGVPILATRVGGIAQLFDNGEDAVLVPPDDPDALAEAMADFLVDPETWQRRAERARVRILARHGPEQKAAALAALWQEVRMEK